MQEPHGWCCEFLKTFTNVQNCVQLLDIAVKLDIIELKKNSILFIVDNLPGVNKDDLYALPVELLLEIIQHPAACMAEGDGIESEKQMFYLIWDKIKTLQEEAKVKYIPKMLKAIHLPRTDKDFLPIDRILPHSRGKRTDY